MSAALIPPVRSSAIPLLPKLSIDLVKAIDDPDQSYEDVWEVIKKMARDLYSRQDVIQVEGMLAAVNHGSREPLEDSMLVLLHSVHPFVLRSVCMGTVAYDFHDELSRNWDKVYSQHGPGAYAVGICIQGRGGKFLTPAEIQDLVDIIHMYASGCNAWKAKGEGEVYGHSQLNDQQQDELRFAMEIDGQFQSSSTLPPTSEDEDVDRDEGHDTETEDEESQELRRPRFASRGTRGSEDFTANIYALASMLRRRLQAAGANRDEPQIQSPLVIGNSRDLQRRKQDYRANVTRLSNAARIYGLLMSGIKCMGLEPKEIFVPFTKAWTVAHIDMGEILGTLVGGSLVLSAGLNVKQAGTRGNSHPPTASSIRDTRYDVNRRDWFLDNLKHSCETSNSAKLQRVLDEVFSTSDEDLRNEMQAVEEARNRTANAVMAGEKAVGQKEKKMEGERRALQEMHRERMEGL